ncbi:TetR/AcrR family transcriptional regulator [Streptomyces chromofuscus]|uniref:TetR/AcrR family transcriptional regulator n=1 Tax=Streptomyces chromofuscus TaxID=42881 RepID=A0A7M2T769_STRCW|nr:TetR/AcrR family transcriptional regulator [Streptomyces chromofuscus]QOV43518.1 TetR/AcrR family transcriptional regulator [Streptomyces chromofuscus]GGT10169.1 TetR family transcriptional regulator [Streptomyces chromofuscus]
MTTAKGRATKARILEAAVDLLVQGGAENLSLDEVLRATKTSKGQLFHYFPGGKEELCHAATERQLERLIAATMPSQLDTWEAWQEWIRHLVHLHELQSQDDACEVAGLAGRALDNDPGTRAAIGRAYEQWSELLRSQLEKMQANGLLRADAPVDKLASMVLTALQGGAVIDKATNSSRHLTSALDLTYTLLRQYAA